MNLDEMQVQMSTLYREKKADGCIYWWENQPVDLFQKNNNDLEDMIIAGKVTFETQDEIFKKHLKKQGALIDVYLVNKEDFKISKGKEIREAIANGDPEKAVEIENKLNILCDNCGKSKNMTPRFDLKTAEITYYCYECPGFLYDGNETTEQRFAEYVARKKFEEKSKPLESPAKHKLEHDILFSNNYTSDIKKEKLEEWRKVVIDEKDSNKMWDEL